VWCTAHDCDLPDVSDDDLLAISPYLTPDVRDVLSVPGALASRSALGGTAPERVAEQLDELRHLVAGHVEWATAG
jgi:argininosuccinate lyase